MTIIYWIFQYFYFTENNLRHKCYDKRKQIYDVFFYLDLIWIYFSEKILFSTLNSKYGISIIFWIFQYFYFI